MAVRLGTSEYGGTFYTQGSAIAELFNRGRSEPDRCVVQTSDASIHNANLLDQGELEFGFMASNWIGRARDAMPPFTRRIALRMVAPANAGPMFFVKLAGSPSRLSPISRASASLSALKAVVWSNMFIPSLAYWESRLIVLHRFIWASMRGRMR